MPQAAVPGAGPTLERIERQAAPRVPGALRLIDINGQVAMQLREAQQRRNFSELWAPEAPRDFIIGAGDTIEVSVWEAPPASLFASGVADPRTGGSAGSRTTVLPEQMIGLDGLVNVPFAGHVRAAGRPPSEVETEIAARLRLMAHQPQVMVRVTRNATRNVTVVGEVAQSMRMPLTPRGERLLDALAAAGGVRQSITKVSVQITRSDRVAAMSLEAVIADPLQNILLRPGDVVTALHQPFALTVLGATGQNAELNFEAQGISLAQALARAGGLQDTRADRRGVFVFRYEDAQTITATPGDLRPTQDQASLPVVYRLDLSDPGSFLLAQGFPMRHRDVLYVANSAATELQKFLNILGSVIVPYATVRNLAP